MAALIRYYQTGDPADWIQFGIAWVQNNPRRGFRQRLYRGVSRPPRR